MKEIDVTGLQCTQAVMNVLREMVSMNKNEEIKITYQEPNARRDIMAMIKRRNYRLIEDKERLLVIAK
tara:strand:- start:218 stop:421 length:204 start_codon:yes stop_codon:yes gene_type:complete